MYWRSGKISLKRANPRFRFQITVPTYQGGKWIFNKWRKSYLEIYLQNILEISWKNHRILSLWKSGPWECLILGNGCSIIASIHIDGSVQYIHCRFWWGIKILWWYDSVLKLNSGFYIHTGDTVAFTVLIRVWFYFLRFVRMFMVCRLDVSRVQ